MRIMDDGMEEAILFAGNTRGSIIINN